MWSSRWLLALALSLLVWCPRDTSSAQLRGETARAWERYIELTEARIAREVAAGTSFLVRDYLPAEVAGQAAETVAAGNVFVHEMETLNEEGREIDVPSGMVHHWYGTVFVPGASLEDVLRWEQDYPRHQDYFDEVEASRLISREGNAFRIFLKLKRTKVITVYYNTEHLVMYSQDGPERAWSKSEATRIAELEDAGTPREREKPAEQDRGFLWRLNSYWRFKSEPGGVVVECESVSLSRSVPRGVAWMVQSFLDSVPRESLENVLLPIRTSLSRPSSNGGR